MTEPLSKVDSAVQGLSSSPKDTKDAKAGHRRQSSSANGVMNINDLGKELTFHLLSLPPPDAGCPGIKLTISLHKEAQGIELQIAQETQKTGW